MDTELNGLVIHDKPISELSLKKLLLVFDKIFFLSPKENEYLIPDKVAKYDDGPNHFTMSAYHLLYNGEFYKEKEELLIDKFDYAYNKGVIRELNLIDRKFYEKNWLPLRLAFDFDTGNATILNSITPKVIKIELHSLKSGIIRGGVFPAKGVNAYPAIPEAVSFFTEEENRKYDCDCQLYSIIGKVNRGLAVCSLYDLIPIFIDENIAIAFDEKFKVAKNNSEIKLNEKYRLSNNIELINIQHLLYRISDCIINDEILNEITVKELVIARNNSINELYKLRRQLLKNLAFLKNASYSDEYLKGVQSFISKEVAPQIDKYRNQFLTSFIKMIGYTGTFSVVSLGTYLASYQGLTPMQIAYITGISATVGNVTSELANQISANKNKEYRNTFSYFIKLNE